VGEAIDTVKGTVTITHEATASIQWPAVTMTLKADPPSLLIDNRIGEMVSFTLLPTGMKRTITTVVPVK